jgi:hypothetical protein
MKIDLKNQLPSPPLFYLRIGYRWKRPKNTLNLVLIVFFYKEFIPFIPKFSISYIHIRNDSLEIEVENFLALSPEG